MQGKGSWGHADTERTTIKTKTTTSTTGTLRIPRSLPGIPGESRRAPCYHNSIGRVGLGVGVGWGGCAGRGIPATDCLSAREQLVSGANTTTAGDSLSCRNIRVSSATRTICAKGPPGGMRSRVQDPRGTVSKSSSFPTSPQPSHSYIIRHRYKDICNPM